MAILMWTPTETEALLCMPEELHLRIDMSCGYTRMFCPVPDHNPTIRAHCCDDVRILWLISSFIDFTLMVNLLNNIEFDLHRRLLCGAGPVAADLFPLFVIFGGVGGDGIRQLTVYDL